MSQMVKDVGRARRVTLVHEQDTGQIVRLRERGESIILIDDHHGPICAVPGGRAAPSTPLRQVAGLDLPCRPALRVAPDVSIEAVLADSILAREPSWYLVDDEPHSVVTATEIVRDLVRSYGVGIETARITEPQIVRWLEHMPRDPEPQTAGHEFFSAMLRDLAVLSSTPLPGVPNPPVITVCYQCSQGGSYKDPPDKPIRIPGLSPRCQPHQAVVSVVACGP
jgi:hypothetical protein